MGVCVWGGGGGESCEMERWGLGEVKGQRKKGGTFSEDGRLERTEGNNNCHVLKAVLPPPNMTPRRGQRFKVTPAFLPLSLQHHFYN